MLKFFLAWSPTGLVALLLCLYLRTMGTDVWNAYGVKQYPHSNWLDNLLIMFGQKSMGDPDESVYKLMEEEKFCGVNIMGTPHLLLKDLDIVKKILIKEFDSFPERRNFGLSKKQPIIERMLASLQGEEWKGVRSALRPTFTSGKIRRMMESFNSVSVDWIQYLRERIDKSGGTSIDINVSKETTRHSVDVIARAVFGMEVRTIRDPNSVFLKMSESLLKFDWKFMFKAGIFMNIPKIADLFGVTLFNQKALDFFENLLVQRMKLRMEGKEERNDFLQIIAEARKGDLTTDESEELNPFEKDAKLQNISSVIEKRNWLNDDLIAAAQMILFFFNGFLQTSNLVGFVLYFMALHPEYQTRLREELDEKLFQDGRQDVDYDVLNSLTYLEMVVCETLRKIAPAARLDRKCLKEYTDTEYGFRVPKDTFVAIPIQAIHNDRKYYDHPDQFYPEHFSPESKAKRNPYAYLPFGGGPRNCIGMRFAVIEVKAAIAHLIHNFEVSVTPTTPVPFKPLGMPIISETMELRLTPVKY